MNRGGRLWGKSGENRGKSCGRRRNLPVRPGATFPRVWGQAEVQAGLGPLRPLWGQAWARLLPCSHHGPLFQPRKRRLRVRVAGWLWGP